VLRTVEDATRLRAKALRARRAVVVGGGVIGLEVASSLRTLGLEVAVVEAGPRLLGRNVPEEPAAWLSALHIAHGVALHLGRTVAALTPEGDGLHAVLDDGTPLAADLVVAGIGLVPETRLATEAGLPGPQGVVVGPGQQTEDPAVLAIGDVALRSPGEGLPAVRHESWAHAQSSAARAARTLLGLPHGAEDVPWFWTAQHGSMLQLAGEMTGAEAVLARGEHVRIYLRGGRLWGAACLDAAKDFATLRRLLATRPALDPARAADPAADLRKAVIG
jgi:3-phenylpropionate/trans-cinnamate dioxygenase ferredoxin reductase subunit